MALTRLESEWRCLVCGDHGIGDRSDKEAERHVRDTGHSTVTRSKPSS